MGELLLSTQYFKVLPAPPRVRPHQRNAKFVAEKDLPPLKRRRVDASSTASDAESGSFQWAQRVLDGQQIDEDAMNAAFWPRRDFDLGEDQ